MIIISKGTKTLNTSSWNDTLYIALLLNKRHRYKVQFIYDIRYTSQWTMKSYRVSSPYTGHIPYSGHFRSNNLQSYLNVLMFCCLFEKSEGF